MEKDSGMSTAESGQINKGSAYATAAASLLLPGLGQLLNRQKTKAIAWFMVPLLLVTIELSTSQWDRFIRLMNGKVPAELIANQSTNGLHNNTTGAELNQADSLGALFAAEEDTTEAAGSGDPFADTTAEASDSGDPFADVAADTSSGDPFADIEAESQMGDRQANYFTAQYLYPNYFIESEKHYPFRDFGGFFTRGVWGLVTLGRLPIDAEYAGGVIELYNKVTPWLTADNSIVLLGNGLIAMAVLVVFITLWVLGVIDAYKTNIAFQKTGVRESSKEFWFRIWDSLYVYVVSAPAFVMILFFTVIPIFFTFFLAFTNYTYKIKLGAKLIEWAGFRTFGFLAMDPGWLSIFGQIFLWTILWALMSSFTVYGLGFFNAMIVESPLVNHKRVWRTLMILPWAIPSLVSLMMFRNAFDKDGLVNQFLFATGLMEPVSNFLFNIGLQGKPDQPIFWFQPIYNGRLARFVVMLVNLWLGAPYHMMMIIGTLSTIPRELYEAAAIDGASGWQRFKYITWPMVLAATMPALIMTFSFNFNNFGAVYFLTGGGPTWDPAKIPDSMRIVGSALPGQTDILISWIYKLSFTKDFEQYNVAAVYSILIFFIVGGFSVYNLLKSKSFQEEAGE
ncbi:carbohydrate ABC transporter permease [Gracilinema caldarium]|uniref:ABC-type transporter, integral membrane subunit n=1 Tax=Gracilinema caldarium (strain ATCC 51460 / DSM 7334 / H1) TaxID=744872 RepID=F8EYA1_GRAC1|nr:ABC transporter permease subunit [Gracilinema caldarium]AEJ18260.1 ABC-type transporter, integral membrane subunit [Gracilinema caldarium DSM 7334]